MKLITKQIATAFDKQGDTSEKSAKDIKIICKFFNPVGGHTWWVYEKIEEDIYMAFVCDGNPMYAECGTISLSELESIELRFGLGIERDRSYDIGSETLQEVINRVKGRD